MDIKEHTTPEKLERYSFLWSEVRLLIAALALFLGGVPPALYFIRVSGLYGTIHSLLTIAWLVSGAAALYLFYKWYKGRMLFGGKVQMDTYAFFVMVVSGVNLGLTGLLGNNIGMSISSNRVVFFVVGLLYLAAAYRLYRSWKSNGERVF
jgi:hypothetical protein